jgi:hypothetical protein
MNWSKLILKEVIKICIKILKILNKIKMLKIQKEFMAKFLAIKNTKDKFFMINLEKNNKQTNLVSFREVFEPQGRHNREIHYIKNCL